MQDVHETIADRLLIARTVRDLARRPALGEGRRLRPPGVGCPYRLARGMRVEQTTQRVAGFSVASGAGTGGSLAQTWFVKRLRGMMSVRGAVALGAFFAWQSTITTSLFPMAGAPFFSPQVTLALLACLTMVVILRGQLALYRVSSATMRALWGLVGVTLGTLAAVGASLAGTKALPLTYACAIVGGAAMSLGLFVWVQPLARIDARRRAGTLLAAIALAQVAGFVMGLLPLGAPTTVAFVLCGLLSVIALVVWDDATEGPASDVTYRPTSSQHYRLLLVAIVLYAFVFGSVAGTSSFQMVPAALGEFTRQVAGPALLVAVLCLAGLFAMRGSVRLVVMGRVLTPVLAVLFLIHLVMPSAVRGWLPSITLAFWQFVQVFVILLLIEISQSGVGSLGLMFSVGWSLLSGGFAVGSLFGSTTMALFGNDETAITAIVVLHTVIAVIASSLMAAARYPQVGGDAPSEAGEPEAAEAAVASAGSAADGGRLRGRGSGVREDGGVAGAGARSVGANARGMADAGGAGPAGAGAPGAGGLRAGAAGASAGGVTGGTGPAGVGAAGGDGIARACAQLAAKHGLSEREGEVLELLARGNTRQSIATKLVVSENTVRTHVKNIYAKLYIHSKQQLIDLVDTLRSPQE